MSLVTQTEKIFQKIELVSLPKKNIYHANLKAGDAIFFTTYLFHGSTPHVAKKIRWTLLSSFHRVDKTPYLKNGKNTLRIPYNVDYNKL